MGHYQLVTDDNGQSYQLVEEYSAPFGIMCLQQADLKAQCREHIEAMAQSSRYATQVTSGSQHTFNKTILEAVQKFGLDKEVGYL